MHDEQAILLCRLRLDERLAEAEWERLVHQSTGGREGWRVLVAGIGGTLVRVGQRLQATGEAPHATATTMG